MMKKSWVIFIFCLLQKNLKIYVIGEDFVCLIILLVVFQSGKIEYYLCKKVYYYLNKRLYLKLFYSFFYFQRRVGSREISFLVLNENENWKYQ